MSMHDNLHLSEPISITEILDKYQLSNVLVWHQSEIRDRP